MHRLSTLTLSERVTCADEGARNLNPGQRLESVTKEVLSGQIGTLSCTRGKSFNPTGNPEDRPIAEFFPLQHIEAVIGGYFYRRTSEVSEFPGT